MVTVMVTNHEATEKDIEGLEKMMSYNMCNTCYELKPLGLDSRTTLVLSNTRELDRVPTTK